MIGVTGANGFVGHALVAHLRSHGHQVRELVRKADSANRDQMSVGDIGAETDWTQALENIDCIVHCAARVHVMRESTSNPLDAFRQVNVEGTRGLARQAAQSGVRRLVFLSTVKVHGESTSPGRPWNANDEARPQDAYSRSKWEAEQSLWNEAAGSGLEVVVVRPPLVYGPGVRANMERLRRWVAQGLPIPLGSVDNRRSLVAVDNLVDLLARCIEHADAPGHSFLVSDGQDLSTPELVCAMASAMGRPARLLPVPPACLRLAGWLTARSAEVERLVGSLVVDPGPTHTTLGWQPPVTVAQGLNRWLGEPRP